MDMLIGDANGKLHLFNNTGSNPPNFVLAEAEYKGLDVGYFAFPQLVDVNRDGLLDIIIGEQSGTPGVAIIAPPNAVRARVIRSHKKRRTAMLSGWALTPGSRYRYQVDQVFPLSDHADYPGLLQSVEKVSPSLVYTVHDSHPIVSATSRALTKS